MRFDFEKLEDLERAVQGAELRVRPLSASPNKGWSNHSSVDSIVCSAGHFEGKAEFSGGFSDTECTIGFTASRKMVAQHFSKPATSTALVLFPAGKDTLSTYNGSMDYIGLRLQPEELLALADRQNISIAPSLLKTGMAKPLETGLEKLFPACHAALTARNESGHSGLISDLMDQVLCHSILSMARGSSTEPKKSHTRHYAKLVQKCREHIDQHARQSITVKSLSNIWGHHDSPCTEHFSRS